MSIFIEDDILTKVADVIGGEKAVDVVMALKELGEATDDQILVYIAEQSETELKLNDIRKTLFKLYNNSIVQCDRLRDENTGWFIFRWRLQLDQIEGFIKNRKKRILKILKSRLGYEQTHDFYFCDTPECERIIFEDAVEYVFRCPKCEKPLRHFDNSKIITALDEKIQQLERELRKQT